MWEGLARGYNKEPYYIRRLLTEGAVQASDKRAVFVGADAYEAAGGVIARDLFQHDGGGWFEDDVALNLEPGRPADGLVVFRKGSGVVTLAVKGKSAHAGVAPESGRNAAMEVAHQILQLGKLGDQEKGTTVNFTVLKAGAATNIIPDSAEAMGDVRVFVPEEFDRVERDLGTKSQAKLIPDTDVKVSLERNFPPMAKNAGTDALADKAQAIYAEIGRMLTLEGSGGAADSSLSAGAGTRHWMGWALWVVRSTHRRSMPRLRASCRAFTC